MARGGTWLNTRETGLKMLTDYETKTKLSTAEKYESIRSRISKRWLFQVKTRTINGNVLYGSRFAPASGILLTEEGNLLSALEDLGK